MELVTDKTKLWYFAPDNEDDIPRYAIAKIEPNSNANSANSANSEATEVIYDEILELKPEDVLKIQPLRVNSDKMQVNFKNESIGLVDFDNDETESKLTNFVAQWKNGLKFLETIKQNSKMPPAQLKQIRHKEEKRKKKMELFKFLCSNLNQYINPKDINVKIITWNLQGKDQNTNPANKPKSEAGINNGHDDMINFKDVLFSDEKTSDPDIYVINLQETVVSNSMSFYSSPVMINEWINQILEILNEESGKKNSDRFSDSSKLNTSDRILTEEKDSDKYEYLTDNRLVGLNTIVIIKRHLKKQISNLEVSTTGSGFLNIFGNNKGAILIKFTFSYDKDILPYITDEEHNELSEEDKLKLVHGYKFVIINTHLTPGENNISKRKKELQAIEKNLNLRSYFKDENFYLTNPLLSNEYFQTNEIDTFRFGDQETIQDNKLLSFEDLSNSKSPNLTNFQDIPLSNNASPAVKKPKHFEPFEAVSRLASPILKDFPQSPTFSIDQATFKTNLSSLISDNKNLNKDLSYFNDCFIFFCGDLSFQLVYNDSIKDQLVSDLLEEKVKNLVEKDSLLFEHKNLNLLNGFHEPQIEFMPTYKFKPAEKAVEAGSQNDSSNDISDEMQDLSISDPEDDVPYDMSVLPSYSDRIFYSEFNIFQESDSEKHVKVNKYSSIPSVDISEHKPVFMDLTLKKLKVIDFEERYKLMKNFLKDIDLQENMSKPIAELSPIEIKESDIPILHLSNVYEFKLHNKGKKAFNWELLDIYNKPISGSNNDTSGHNATQYVQVETTDGTVQMNMNYLKERMVEISPTRGILPSGGIQKIRVQLNSINVGIKKILVSLILRVIDSKDFFLNCEFITKKSIFGESLDLLNNIEQFGSSSGIPPSIYELINYLSNNLDEKMFSEVDNSEKFYLNDADLSIREQLENNGTLNQDYINKIKKFNGSEDELTHEDNLEIIQAIVRTLLLLLKHLDGGIVPLEFSEFILGEIQLPNMFFLNLSSHDNFQLQSDITTKILEFLPGLRANVFMYLISFLNLFLSNFKNFDKNNLLSLFEESLIALPPNCSRAVRSKRREVLKILLN